MSLEPTATATDLAELAESRRAEHEQRWWRREVALMRSLERLGWFRQYVMAQRRRAVSFTGLPLPPCHEGGPWWARFHRAQLLALGLMREKP